MRLRARSSTNCMCVRRAADVLCKVRACGRCGDRARAACERPLCQDAAFGRTLLSLSVTSFSTVRISPVFQPFFLPAPCAVPDPSLSVCSCPLHACIQDVILCEASRRLLRLTLQVTTVVFDTLSCVNAGPYRVVFSLPASTYLSPACWF